MAGFDNGRCEIWQNGRSDFPAHRYVTVLGVLRGHWPASQPRLSRCRPGRRPFRRPGPRFQQLRQSPATRTHARSEYTTRCTGAHRATATRSDPALSIGQIAPGAERAQATPHSDKAKFGTWASGQVNRFRGEARHAARGTHLPGTRSARSGTRQRYRGSGGAVV